MILTAMDIQFMNGKRERTVVFNDFRLIEKTNLISYNINVACPGFTAVSASCSEIYDFEYLADGLDKLYCRSIDSFEFRDIEGHLTMKIQYTETGLITWHFHIRDTDYSIDLYINFTSDQTFIPDILHQLRETCG